MFKWFAEKSGVMSCVCMVFALIGMAVLAFAPSVSAALAMSITYVVVGFAGIGLVTGGFYLAAYNGLNVDSSKNQLNAWVSEDCESCDGSDAPERKPLVRGRRFFTAHELSTPVANEPKALFITETLTKYRVLLEEVNSDRKIINWCLNDLNQESKCLKKTWEQSAAQTYQSINAVFYTPVINEVTLMWDELDRLMTFDPKTNFSVSVTSSEINEAYDALELNHSQLVTLAETLLPNLRSLLNEAKLEHETSGFRLK